MNTDLRLKLEQHSFISGLNAAIGFLPKATNAIRQGHFLPAQSAHIRSNSGQLIAISGSSICYPFSASTPNAKLLSSFICSIEDRRFNRHKGVDLVGLLRAAIWNIRSGKIVQGGSTITQQLARTIFLSPHRSMLRKLCEMWLAREIEKKWPKQQILNAYCDFAYLGRGISGFEAASRFIFRKKLASLVPNELAALVPLLRAPNRYHPTTNLLRFTEVAERTTRSLGLSPPALAKLNPIDTATFRSPRLTQIVFRELHAKGIAESEVEQVTTTIDSSLQGMLDRIIKQETKANCEIASISAVFLSNATGDVLAESSWANGVATEHSPSFYGRIQPGSTFKTFCLIAALEQGYGPDVILDSAPFRSFVDGQYRSNKEWQVRNYRDQYFGVTTIGDALIRSDNSAFARLIEQLDQSLVAKVYARFGLCSINDFTPSAVLGGVRYGISLLQLASAYSAIARNGVLVAPRLVKGVCFRDGTSGFFPTSPSLAAIDYATAQVVRKLLASTSSIRTSVVFEGKTGTTRRGSVFAGYNEKVSAAVWINYREPQNEDQHKGITARSLLERIGDALLGHPSGRLLEII